MEGGVRFGFSGVVFGISGFWVFGFSGSLVFGFFNFWVFRFFGSVLGIFYVFGVSVHIGVGIAREEGEGGAYPSISTSIWFNIPSYS